jgi:hypothetical protein
VPFGLRIAPPPCSARTRAHPSTINGRLKVWDKFGMDKKEKAECDALAADIVKQLNLYRHGGAAGPSAHKPDGEMHRYA